MPAGAPEKYNSEELTNDLLEYIYKTAIPIIKEFSVSKRIPRTYLYHLADNCKELSDAMELCVDAKEVGLERGMQRGEINPSYGNLALKQLGWKERSETEFSGGLNIVRAELPAKLPVGSPVDL
jgi:hypothetical protein